GRERPESGDERRRCVRARAPRGRRLVAVQRQRSAGAARQRPAVRRAGRRRVRVGSPVGHPGGAAARSDPDRQLRGPRRAAAGGELPRGRRLRGRAGDPAGDRERRLGDDHALRGPVADHVVRRAGRAAHAGGAARQPARRSLGPRRIAVPAGAGRADHDGVRV
ncbi:MAG: hypothetical protein AVDCRST_MAG47-301, partial [uncultured Nocardioidaceae bacterium]